MPIFTAYTSVKLSMIGMELEELVLTQTDEIKEAFSTIIFLMVSWNLVKRLKAVRASQTGLV